MFHVVHNISQPFFKNCVKVLHRSTILSSIGLQSSFFHSSIRYGFSQYISSTDSLVKKKGEEIICDLGLFDGKSSKIQSLIILNNEPNHKLLRKSIDITDNIVLADGGANHIYDIQRVNDRQKIKAVVGDLDCIKPEVLDYYNDLKVPIQYMSNLEDNDFCKALEFCLQQNWRQIFCFGAFGGRMDQTLSSMHYCQKYSKIYPQLEIFLFGKQNMMYFLKANHTYHIRCDQRYISKFGCGILTFGKVNHIETKGFKYNLGEQQKYKKLQWGQFISTSNQMTEENCVIRGSENLYFVVNYSEDMLN